MQSRRLTQGNRILIFGRIIQSWLFTKFSAGAKAGTRYRELSKSWVRLRFDCPAVQPGKDEDHGSQRICSSLSQSVLMTRIVDRNQVGDGEHPPPSQPNPVASVLLPPARLGVIMSVGLVQIRVPRRGIPLLSVAASLNYGQLRTGGCCSDAQDIAPFFSAW